MGGHFSIHAFVWEAVAERLVGLGEVWTWEEMMGDLAYWDDQVRLYQKSGGRLGRRRRPGRNTLQRRWGNPTDHTVKKALKAEHIWTTDFRQNGARTSPDNHQESTRTPPEQEQEELGFNKESTRTSPDNHQTITRESPERRPTRVGDRSTIHEPRTTKKTSPHTPQGGKKVSDPLWKVSGPPSPAQRPHVELVWKHYRTRHPLSDETPNDQSARYITWALRVRAKANKKSSSPACAGDPWAVAVKQCTLVIDWCHEAPDAYYLQGFHESGKVKKKGGWLGITNVFMHKSFDDRTTSAKVWQAAGRPRNPMLDQEHADQYREEAFSVWTTLMGMTQRRTPPPPEKISDDPAIAKAALSALSKFRWTDLGRSDTYQLQDYKKQFLSAYTASRSRS